MHGLSELPNSGVHENELDGVDDRPLRWSRACDLLGRRLSNTKLHAKYEGRAHAQLHTSYLDSHNLGAALLLVVLVLSLSTVTES